MLENGGFFLRRLGNSLCRYFSSTCCKCIVTSCRCRTSSSVMSYAPNQSPSAPPFPSSVHSSRFKTLHTFARAASAPSNNSTQHFSIGIKKPATESGFFVQALAVCLLYMVPGAGIEPARSYLRGILSPLRLPIPPSGR